MTTTRPPGATSPTTHPEQIAELEYCERENIPPGDFDRRRGQLNRARMVAVATSTKRYSPGIPAPSEAVRTVS